jgi:MFS family permease
MSSVAAGVSERMTSRERRASVALASIAASRLFGLFLILPVFAVHARGMPGGENGALVGLALGVYALTQAALQLPFGVASDRFGRKPVIVAGLLMFALGSFVAAAADSVAGVVVGRAIQGGGAISAAVSAFVADSTRDSQRTKAMAMVGGSIGISFALSLVAAPALYAGLGMAGIFEFTGALALLAILVTLFVVPPAEARAAAHPSAGRTTLREVALEGDLMRLNFGIFALHAVQMAMFVVLPRWLVERAGLPLADHWVLYLVVVVLSFVPMVPALIAGERRGRMRTVFLGAVGAVALSVGALALQPAGLVAFAVLLFAFFAGFNVLEAALPSLVSRLAPPDAKGAALGLYSTTQSMGLFVGGAAGGWVFLHWGGAAVFGGCALVLVVWFGIASGHRRWPRRAAA